MVKDGTWSSILWFNASLTTATLHGTFLSVQYELLIERYCCTVSFFFCSSIDNMIKQIDSPIGWENALVYLEFQCFVWLNSYHQRTTSQTAAIQNQKFWTSFDKLSEDGKYFEPASRIYFLRFMTTREKYYEFGHAWQIKADGCCDLGRRLANIEGGKWQWPVYSTLLRTQSGNQQ